MMIYSPSSQPGNHHQWWYVTQCHFYYKWFVALWKIHVFNLCTSSCSPPSSLCYWFAWHWNTGENKRKIEHWRVAPVFKRILRMGIPALIGRGGESPYIRTRSSLHPKSRFGPDISSTEASHQTPFRKLTTLISRCFPAHMEIIYERWLTIFSDSYRFFVCVL